MKYDFFYTQRMILFPIELIHTQTMKHTRRIEKNTQAW